MESVGLILIRQIKKQCSEKKILSPRSKIHILRKHIQLPVRDKWSTQSSSWDCQAMPKHIHMTGHHKKHGCVCYQVVLLCFFNNNLKNIFSLSSGLKVGNPVSTEFRPLAPICRNRIYNYFTASFHSYSRKRLEMGILILQLLQLCMLQDVPVQRAWPLTLRQCMRMEES